MRFWPTSKRAPASLRSYVFALAAVLVFPPLLGAGLAVRAWVASEEQRLQEVTTENTNSLLVQVDTLLAGQIATLQALATSPALDAGNLVEFDRQARDILALQGTHLVLRDRTGQQLVNTRLPWGSPCPTWGRQKWTGALSRRSSRTYRTC